MVAWSQCNCTDSSQCDCTSHAGCYRLNAEAGCACCRRQTGRNGPCQADSWSMRHWTPLSSCKSLTSSQTQTQACPKLSCSPASTLTLPSGASPPPEKPRQKDSAQKRLLPLKSPASSNNRPRSNHYQPHRQSVTPVVPLHKAGTLLLLAHPLQDRSIAKLQLKLAVQQL